MLTYSLLYLLRWDLLAIQPAEDPRIGYRVAPDHDRVTAGVLLHPLDVGYSLHITAADHGDLDQRFHLGDRAPVRFACITLFLRAPVDGDQRTALFFHN